MRFTCDKAVIIKEISVAQEIIASRNALTVLSNVLIDVKEDALTLKATDLKVSFETRIPVIAEEEGSTSVFCDRLLSILRSFPDGDINFVQDADNDKLTITNGDDIIFHLHSVKAEKYPETPKIDAEVFFSMPQKHLIEMIGQTIFSISDDKTRYFMNGVYMEKNKDKLLMVATDGRRLSHIVKNLGDEARDFESIIIPPKVLNLVRKLASGEGEVHLAVTGKMFFIHFDNQKITSTLIEGKFPNYSRVIPDAQEHKIQVNRNSLLESIQRVALLSEKKSKRIYMSVESNRLTLKSLESEVGAAEAHVGCRFEGPEAHFAMNHVYLSDPLRMMETEEVELQFTDPAKAFTLVSTPVSDYFHILMPMQKE